jgi:nucleotide-binding universal stress UspA family protein
MKEIIVGIDFSKSCIHALEFAIDIANDMKANILMVHVDKPYSPESTYSKKGAEHKEKLVALFEKLIKKYKPAMNGTLAYKIRKGKVHVEMANQAKYSDAVLLIAGTHGVSGVEEFWIGSNAYKMVTSAPCPVITVREGFIWKKKRIAKIVIPIDSTIETRQKTPVACEIAKACNAEIHVLAIHSSKQKDIRKLVDKYSEQTCNYIKSNGVKCELITIDCDNITNATLEYAANEKADLIAIMTEQETTTSNLWLGPYAQQMVNHSPIPVLTVHAQDIYDVRTKEQPYL